MRFCIDISYNFDYYKFVNTFYKINYKNGLKILYG